MTSHIIQHDVIVGLKLCNFSYLVLAITYDKFSKLLLFRSWFTEILLFQTSYIYGVINVFLRQKCKFFYDVLKLTSSQNLVITKQERLVLLLKQFWFHIICRWTVFLLQNESVKVFQNSNDCIAFVKDDRSKSQFRGGRELPYMSDLSEFPFTPSPIGRLVFPTNDLYVLL